jgi:hypothetical protein
MLGTTFIKTSSQRDDLHVGGLLVAERETIAADFEGDWIPKGGTLEDFDGGAVAEAHFEEASADVGGAGDGDDSAVAADAEFIQAAGRG